MKNNIVVLVCLAVIVVAVVLIVRNANRPDTVEEAHEKVEKAIYAEEVYCTACEATSRKQCQLQDALGKTRCPACGELAAYAYVYSYCQNPACNKRIVKAVFGQPLVCPECGKPDFMAPAPAPLEKIRAIAKETGQEMP